MIKEDKDLHLCAHCRLPTPNDLLLQEITLACGLIPSPGLLRDGTVIPASSQNVIFQGHVLPIDPQKDIKASIVSNPRLLYLTLILLYFIFLSIALTVKTIRLQYKRASRLLIAAGHSGTCVNAVTSARRYFLCISSHLTSSWGLLNTTMC